MSFSVTYSTVARLCGCVCVGLCLFQWAMADSGGDSTAAFSLQCEGNWCVFRSTDNLTLRARFDDTSCPEAGRLTGQIVDSAGAILRPLPAQDVSKGDVTWSVPLAGFDVGTYKAVVTCHGQNAQHPSCSQEVVFDVRANGARLLPSAPSLTESQAGKLLTITMINVNNGNFVCESLLIRTPSGKTMLIDAGWPSNFTLPEWGETNYGPNIIPEFLKSRRITTLDWMMLSHPHDDHIGCMAELVDSADVSVKQFLWSPLSQEALHASEPDYAHVYDDLVSELCGSCARHNVPILTVQAGQRLDLGDGVVCDVLAVAEPNVSVPNFINNNSIVMQLRYGDFSMMFTGDAGTEQESRVLALKRDLTSDVLKIGHHAGAGSTSVEWTEAVAAKVGLASMPEWLAKDQRGVRVTEQLASSRMNIYRTFQHGHIDVKTDGRRFWVVTEK